jgi:hypothetical protein
MRIIVAILILIGAAGAYFVHSANDTSARLDQRWAAHVESSETVIDHSEWQLLLDDYLVTDADSGVYLFDYSGLLDDGREPLDAYVQYLTEVDPLTLNRSEQKAYWINLYNALTVRLIMDNYPLASITTLGSNPLVFGPWSETATHINDVALSLNDIEHRIIRPLYDDYRIHFAVNCASIGCPNLAAEAFTADALDEQLDQAAADFLSHPRGLSLDGDTLNLSSLFEWYAVDFGDDQAEVLTTLGRHIDADTRDQLMRFDGTPVYAYDWGLNGYCSIDNECG